MKTSQKFKFYFREAHIFSQSDITMLYTNFFEILKNIEFRFKKQRGYPSILPKKYLFTMKTCRKFVFHPRTDHILALLDITMLYTIF
jgi:hypothetical protein